MARKELTEEDFINEWMIPYHGITIEEAYEKDPWPDSRTFYQRYAVTQEQHDQWNDKAKEMFGHHFRLSKSNVDRHWGLTYLNVSPTVKQS